MNGPSFDDRGLTEEVRIVDLAPTILHSMGIAIPDDMDGEVLDVFSEESNVSERQPTFQPPIGIGRSKENRDSDEVEQRLANLGYLE